MNKTGYDPNVPVLPIHLIRKFYRHSIEYLTILRIYFPPVPFYRDKIIINKNPNNRLSLIIFRLNLKVNLHSCRFSVIHQKLLLIREEGESIFAAFKSIHPPVLNNCGFFSIC